MTPERYLRLRAVLDRRQPDLTLITDNVHKGRNLSAIVRTADAAGIAEMHAVIDDKDYKAFRGTAMGSHSWVEVKRHRDIGGLITGLQAQGVQVLAAHLDGAHRLTTSKPSPTASTQSLQSSWLASTARSGTM